MLNRLRRSSATILAGGRICALVAGIVMLAPGSAAADTLEDALDRGYIEIGIANAPPWTEMTSQGEITGGAPDITIAVLKNWAFRRCAPRSSNTAL